MTGLILKITGIDKGVYNNQDVNCFSGASEGTILKPDGHFAGKCNAKNGNTNDVA